MQRCVQMLEEHETIELISSIPIIREVVDLLETQKFAKQTGEKKKERKYPTRIETTITIKRNDGFSDLISTKFVCGWKGCLTGCTCPVVCYN